MTALAKDVYVDGVRYAAGTDHSVMPAAAVDEVRNPNAWVGGVAPALSYVPAGKNRLMAGDFTTSPRLLAALGLDGRYPKKSEGALSVKDFGAKGDGVADDTAAIQAAIDSLASSATGLSAGRIWMPPGIYKITSTLLISKKALTLEGSGAGHAPVNSASKHTSLRWAGSAGVPMLQVRDSIRVKIADIRFEGNTTNLPSAAINSKWLTGDSVGGNHFLELDRLLFNAPEGSSGSSFENNVTFDGDNGANDSFRISNCQFNQASGALLNIVNTQSVTGAVRDCWFMGRFTSTGIETASTTALYNVFFDACVVDVKANSTAQVDAFGWSSERSGLIAWGASTSGPRFNIYGGYWLTSSVANNTFVKHDGCGENGGVNLYGIKITNDGTKKLVVTGVAGSTKVGYLTVANCNLTPAVIEATAAASGAGIQLNIADNGRVIKALLTGGRTWLGANDPGRDIGAGWRRVSQHYVTGMRTSVTATLMTANVEYAMPVYIDDVGVLENLGLAVTGAGTAGSLIRLGIRKSNGAQPGTLLLDAGTVAGDAVANPTLTISQAVTPGVYWFTATAQSITTTAPTVSMMASSTLPSVGHTTFGGAVGSNGTYGGYVTAATVTGALPNSYTVANPAVVPVMAARWA